MSPHGLSLCDRDPTMPCHCLYSRPPHLREYLRSICRSGDARTSTDQNSANDLTHSIVEIDYNCLSLT
jgi:hypothetical protein